MFHNKITLVYLLFSCSLFMAVYVNFDSPPDGYTGAPDEFSCRACHSSPPDPVQMSIAVQNLPTNVVAGQIYPVTIALTTDYGTFAGFEAVSLNEDLDNAGAWSNAGADVTFSASNNRRYAKQSSAPFMSGVGTGNHFHNFTMSWQAGEVSEPEAVTIWVAGVCGGETEGPAEDGFSSSSRTVMVYPILGAEQVQQTRVSCFGSADGSITVGAIGGKSPYNYDWSNGGSGATINNLAAGNYSVTITDDLNQQTQMSFILAEPAELAGEISVLEPVGCNNGSNGSLTVVPSEGIPPYFYEWSNGQSGAVISNLSAGFYDVSIYDGNNCQTIADIDLENPAQLSWELLQLVPEDCDGLANGAISILAHGGIPAYQYSWSNGAMGSILEGLTAGEYDLTVTDAVGCELVTDFIIPVSSNLSLETIAQEQVSCQGGSDGLITVAANGGAAPYTYQWSNGQSSANLQNLTAGTYSLTVSDDLGCSFMTSFQLQEPLPLSISNVEIVDATIENGGRINLSVSGGTAPYTYMWSGPNGFTSTASSINNLMAGIYMLMVRDAQGCVITNANQPFEVSQITSTATVLASDQIRLYPNPTGSICYLETPYLNANLRAYTLTGQLTWEQNISGQKRLQLPVGEWPSGVYILAVKTDNGLVKKQLVVE